ncbi:sensor domain-containing diguanylate cyclase [Priestia megaterium]|nr:sensor domain-containing diguanylate cyclase [Priestia megaterium]
MTNEQNEIIKQLKGILFELIDVEYEIKSMEKVIHVMLQKIVTLISAEEAFIVISNKKLTTHTVLVSTDSLQNGSQSLPSALQKEFVNMQKRSSMYILNDLYAVIPLKIEEYNITLCIVLKNDTDKDTKLWRRFSFNCVKFLKSVYNNYQVNTQKVRYEKLYKMTEKFHGSMNSDHILEEVIDMLDSVYPNCNHTLFLTHDYQGDKKKTIRLLSYDHEEMNEDLMSVYVTGETKIITNSVNQFSVYAPLVGAQGTYGVLQIKGEHAFFFSKEEVSFIKCLSETAASALEKAQLYLSSQRNLADLKLINETSRHLNANLRLNDIIHYVTNQILLSFQAEEVGFVLIEQYEHYAFLKGSTSFFEEKEAIAYVHYAHKRIMNENEAIFVNDIAIDFKNNLLPYQSMIAVPMIQDDQLKGISLILHTQPYFFSFDSFKLIQSIVHHSTLAFSNAMLREELEKLVVTDHLSKLYSRSYLDERIYQSMLEDSHGSFILLDIDNFKCVNDTFGHQIGDQIIIQVSNIIKENIRAHDIGARWGGEELAIYLPGVSLSIAKKIADRLVKKIAEETKPTTTVSCGVSFWSNETSDSMKKLFNRADEALYQAKRLGKNQALIQKMLINDKKS